MRNSVPLFPFPFQPMRKLIHGFYPFSALVLRFYPSLELELAEAEFRIEAKDYVGAAILAFLTYFSAATIVLASIAQTKNLLPQMDSRLAVLFFSFAIAFSIFVYIMSVPAWVSSRRKAEIEKNLLFATRHLLIQTTAGVPLFDSIVSISEDYADPNLNYGEISREFRRIVKEVRGGKELGEALEESAARNPSPYYKRLMWQLANSSKAGSNTGAVLRDVVDFLSNEQRILIRNYGSELNPLAMFYLIACIIAPTMGLIFLAIFSNIATIPITEFTFMAAIGVLVVGQIIFIGLIKSRRPTVAFS
ncbi:MAG: type II secretion system F family protein [Candidatus Micrarchaeota archaeon]|nr:type II secretion system F family protein [Candidatus Micrarchaeota archaeon]